MQDYMTKWLNNYSFVWPFFVMTFFDFIKNRIENINIITITLYDVFSLSYTGLMVVGFYLMGKQIIIKAPTIISKLGNDILSCPFCSSKDITCWL